MNSDNQSGDLENSSLMNLICAARTGDQTALSQLIERYRNYLLLIANSELDQDLKAKLGASDVVQQSMFQAQQHFHQFIGNNEHELQAWLRKILQNDLRKNRRHYATRKRNSNQEVNLADHSAVGRGLKDDHLTPSTEAIEREKARALESAMSELTDDYRQVIRLRNFEQLAFEDIGKQLDRSAEASRKLWARAIEALQEELNRQSPDLMTGFHKTDDGNG